jgi:quaternary ammonium compound-resistance protein SugE
MSWLILVISGLLEAVWALALDRSEGFSRLWPTLVFAAAVSLSMAGLGYAMRELPVGTSYAVWVGIGATVTVAVGMATGAESFSIVKVALLMGLIGCIIGLKLVG